jgi:hypothetical protein
MRHQARLLLLGLLIVFFSSSPAFPQSLPVGQAQVIEGKVSANLPNETERLLKVSSSIFTKDTLKTGAASKAQFLFLDQTTLTMTAESEMLIDNYVYAYNNPPSANQIILKFGQGLFRAVTGKITKKSPEKFHVDTPLLDVGIRGTDFGVQNRETNSLIAVFNGGPAVVSDKEFNKRVEVPAGKYVTKEKGQAMSDAQDIPAAVQQSFEKAKQMPPGNPDC